MNQPQYIIEIKQRDFACLGEELAEIVTCIRKSYKNCIWYACDVDTYGDNLKIEQLMTTSQKNWKFRRINYSCKRDRPIF